MKNKIKLSLALLMSTTLFANDNNSTVDLNEVMVVSAAGFEQNIADAPATITVISGEEIRKKSFTDITDVLKNVPGVFVSGGGSQQDILIRGMSSDYTLFLIDGRPMQGNNAFSPNGNGHGNQVNFLPSLENIERIEVIRGPASSRYGSDAMGGVINIITKKHTTKPTASITFEYLMADSSNELNNDSKNTTIHLATPIIDNLLSIAINGSFLDIDESDYLDGESGFERDTFGGELTFTPDTFNTLKLGFSTTEQVRSSTPGKTIDPTATDRSGNLLTYSESIAKKYSYFLSHEARYDDFVINSYLNYDKAKNPSRVNSSTGNGIEFDTLTANTQGTYFFENHATSAGINYKTEKLEDGATSSLTDEIVSMERYQYSLFFEDEWSLTNDLALTLSGRYDDNEVFGSNFSPKGYLVYHLNDEWTLKGGVITGYKAPSLRNSAPDYAGVSRGGVMIGNPDLKPEKSLSYEAGIAYDNYDLGLKASLVAFKTDFEDKITRTSRICDANVVCTYKGTTYEAHQYGYTAYENVDEAEIKGIELTTDYEITNDLTYRHSYTFTDSEQKSGTNAGKPLNNIPEHMLNVGIDWDVNNNLSTWTQINYRGETSGSVSRSGDVVKNPAYTFVDLGLVYDISENMNFKTGIYNVANKKVTDSDGYSDTLDGRKYSFALEVTF